MSEINYKNRFERLVKKAEKGDRKARKLLLNMAVAGGMCAMYGPGIVPTLRQIAKDFTVWLHQKKEEPTEDEIDSCGYEHLMTDLLEQGQKWTCSDTDWEVEYQKKKPDPEELWWQLQEMEAAVQALSNRPPELDALLESVRITLDRHTSMKSVIGG